jgi:hypothetical protein
MGEVIVDGVTFVFDASGTKLVKAASRPADEAEASSSSAPPASPNTPLRTNVNGQKFVRTKTGNLISAELLAKRKEARERKGKMKRLEGLTRDVAERQALR